MMRPPIESPRCALLSTVLMLPFADSNILAKGVVSRQAQRQRQRQLLVDVQHVRPAPIKRRRTGVVAKPQMIQTDRSKGTTPRTTMPPMTKATVFSLTLGCGLVAGMSEHLSSVTMPHVLLCYVVIFLLRFMLPIAPTTAKLLVTVLVGVVTGVGMGTLRRRPFPRGI